MKELSFIKTNYHTHTTFCDGKDSVQDMIECAISKDFDILGFSSHSLYPFSSDWHMNVRDHAEYAKHIREMADKYKNKIKVMLGFEADFIDGWAYPDFDAYKDFSPDYLIGAIHYVPSDKIGYYGADCGIEENRNQIKKFFNNDIKKAVSSYFAAEREMLKQNSFTILAHPDLIRIQNRDPNTKLFDENEQWYKDELKATAEQIAKAGVCVEINTGGMARGYMTQPYPSPYFLSLLHDRNVPVTLSADAHKSCHLDFWFEEGKQYAKMAGYNQIAFITDDGLSFQNI